MSKSTALAVALGAVCVCLAIPGIYVYNIGHAAGRREGFVDGQFHSLIQANRRAELCTEAIAHDKAQKNRIEALNKENEKLRALLPVAEFRGSDQSVCEFFTDTCSDVISDAVTDEMSNRDCQEYEEPPPKEY